MKTLFELLDAIEKRPAMYVGSDDGERGRQLHDLEKLLEGYALAAFVHVIDEPGANFHEEFGEYLTKRFGWTMERGPFPRIQQAAGSDDEAWHLFWKLVHEFRASLAP